MSHGESTALLSAWHWSALSQRNHNSFPSKKYWIFPELSCAVNALLASPNRGVVSAMCVGCSVCVFVGVCSVCVVCSVCGGCVTLWRVRVLCVRVGWRRSSRSSCHTQKQPHRQEVALEKRDPRPQAAGGEGTAWCWTGRGLGVTGKVSWREVDVGRRACLQAEERPDKEQVLGQ